VTALLRLSSRLALALVIAVLIGLLAAAAALPVVVGGGVAAQQRLDGYLALPTDLETRRSRSAAASWRPTAR